MPTGVLEPAPARSPLAPSTWPVHLLAVVAVVAAVLLGRWQYHVWQGHRADSASAVEHLAAAPLDRVLGPDAAFPDDGLGRPVVVGGRWAPSQTVLVSGREHDGHTGYWVVTPVVEASGSEIPVVRGWTASRSVVPSLGRGPASFVGLLQPSDESGADDDDTSDRVIPALSVTDLLQRTKRDLYDGYVVATTRQLPGGSPTTARRAMAGLSPVTPHLAGADASTALRNLLYAFQWWFFAAFAVFMWWRWLSEDVLGRPRSRLPFGPPVTPPATPPVGDDG